MFGQGEGYDAGFPNGRIGWRLTIVLQPPAFLEKTAWQAGGWNCDCLGRIVHGATMASAFAEFVQKLRSSSGKLAKSERSDHRTCMRSEKSCRRPAILDEANLALREGCLKMEQSLVDFNPVFPSFQSAYGLPV
ncbi:MULTISPECIES: hypothetical protein [Rhizobium]|uniref:Uncharacterized protein n=1 Tax=Rhizobium tropici TaxID=398 RepID=A0A6P1CC64_RHITR|nr:MULTISPECIES: hypothetical protein [Rhizobium]MBB4242899.1 hypothetical protein [Rhizobium tropici]MBB5594686.1 hypothetical protein [Rhizobium tropici]MBB6493224.1 hypothetical protein [Rhizobium tropici]NEV14021.1 hypothetical protein [Rhizobium tropici]TGE95620.1 hypothetical protein C9417_19135 [Rhizobium sp. SEMIA 4088]